MEAATFQRLFNFPTKIPQTFCVSDKRRKQEQNVRRLTKNDE
jgi:hypothetical protein